MWFRFKSLRQKVLFGYLSGLLLIAGVAVLNLNNLHNVEDMVIAGDRVSTFFETTLEIRRFEKNYFLYKAEDDYDKLMGFVAEADGMLKNSGGQFMLFVRPQEVSALKENLTKYREAWAVYRTYENWASSDVWEGRIREIGRAVVTSAEGMSKAKSGMKQKTLRYSRDTLAISIFIIVAASLVSGQLFYSMFVKPLSIMEKHMTKIAGGEFALIPFETADREIVSLNRAFNRMLMELDARQKRFVFQSEKLAALGTMVSGVAHQLNNPLSNISSSCQILIEELEDKDLAYKKELLDQVEGQVERAKGMIHSLLEFSRKKDFKTEPLPLVAMLEDTVKLLKGDIPSGVEVELDVPDDIWIRADKQRMEQVFLNIIKNGIDAIPDEGKVLITAREAAGVVELKFTDSGMGIEPEDAGRIFEPFFTTKPDGKGSGLGLFVAKEIVEEHNGLIEVESSPGGGTTFIIKLPVKET